MSREKNGNTFLHMQHVKTEIEVFLPNGEKNRFELDNKNEPEWDLDSGSFSFVNDHGRTIGYSGFPFTVDEEGLDEDYVPNPLKNATKF